jgi:hypothetical protein
LTRKIFRTFYLSVDGCFDKFRRDLRDDSVSKTAQHSHSAGKPMSQREKLGFNWYAPRFSVSALDDSVF